MSTYVDPTAAAVEHCESMAQQHPNQAETWNAIGQYCREKLWHQLTLTVLEFMNATNDDGTTQNGSHFGPLYHTVIQPIASKLLPLAVARMAVATAQELASHQQDVTAAKAVLENAMETYAHDMEAKIYLESKHSMLALSLYLQQPNFTLANCNDEAKTMLATIIERLQTNDGILQELILSASVDSVVPAAHYQAALGYYKLIGPARSFYDNALAYTQYATPDAVLATDICLAALTADGVYNVTAAIPHVTLAPEWLQAMVAAVAEGNLDGVEAVQAQAMDQPALVQGAAVVMEKVRLTALVQLALRNPRRALTFEEIQAAVRLPEIELLVMRAFSVGWVKGSIDQVEGVVQIDYVEPHKSLNKEQRLALADRFDTWSTSVQSRYTQLKEQSASSLLA